MRLFSLAAIVSVSAFLKVLPICQTALGVVVVPTEQRNRRTLKKIECAWCTIIFLRFNSPVIRLARRLDIVHFKSNLFINPFFGEAIAFQLQRLSASDSMESGSLSV